MDDLLPIYWYFFPPINAQKLGQLWCSGDREIASRACTGVFTFQFGLPRKWKIIGWSSFPKVLIAMANLTEYKNVVYTLAVPLSELQRSPQAKNKQRVMGQ